jgi:hypothetical protein
MATKIFFEGEKGQAICGHCGLVDTTFKYRDVPLSESRKIVPQILVGVCDTCDCLAAIPAQSTPAIKAVREGSAASIEAVLPAPFVEILDLAAFKIDAKASSGFRKQLLTYYIHQVSSGKISQKVLGKSLLNIEKFCAGSKTKVKKRVSLKVSSAVADEFDSAAVSLDLSKTALMKSLVGEIKSDILDKSSSANIETLRVIAKFS